MIGNSQNEQSGSAGNYLQSAEAMISFKRFVKELIDKDTWKNKSLDSNPVQRYALDLPQIVQQIPSVQQKKSLLDKLFSRSKSPKNQHAQINKILPSPQIQKLNRSLYGIYIQTDLRIFYINTDPKTEFKRTFENISFKAKQSIIFIKGTQDNLIFIGYRNEVQVIKLEKQKGKYIIEPRGSIKIDNVKLLTIYQEQQENQDYQIFLLTKELVIQLKIKEHELTIAHKFLIKAESQDKINKYNILKPTCLIARTPNALFYFATQKTEKTRVQFATKKQQNNNLNKSQKAEILTVVEIVLSKNLAGARTVKSSSVITKSKLKQVEQGIATINNYEVDYVFQLGIFNRAKVFLAQDNMFLMSLYEEVILIRKHFQKYIVWDNVSILSSKNQEKKGQLTLASRRIMVYAENYQIYAFDIHFDFKMNKIYLPPIDSFKGIDNEKEFLYDALIIQKQNGDYINVLFFFKKNEVRVPNKSKYAPMNDQNNKNKSQDKLTFSIICITQSQPKQKLLLLLKQKKPTNQINVFVQRFNISQLQRNKIQWEVSGKTLKDIQNSLLAIKDNDFIQEELNKILKEKPHDLNFLIAVEKKQKQRLRRAIADQILEVNQQMLDKMNQTSYGKITQQERDLMIQSYNEQKDQHFIEKLIQLLMQSMMFHKKLNYSKNFLVFKEYDFIEIGKLKASSLKQQIKLLSSKKFQKRLKYFLNSFKYMAIANFPQIFSFLMENKTLEQIQDFLLTYKFILPNPTESSYTFQKRGKNPLFMLNKMTQAITNLTEEGRCIMWDDFRDAKMQEDMEEMRISYMKQTILSGHGEQSFDNLDMFINEISKQIDIRADELFQNHEHNRIKQKAKYKFVNILHRFIQKSWFKNAAFKQHSILTVSTIDLENKFIQLKTDGVLKILIKFLYQNIESKKYNVHQVQQLLQKLVINNVIPQGFKRNVQARVEVYQIIEKQIANYSARKYNTQDDYFPLKSKFLIMNQEIYFDYLFRNHRTLILKEIKSVYDKIDPMFFQQRFQLFLVSSQVNLQMLINFLDQFKDENAQDIRHLLFKYIKKMLYLNNYDDAKQFINKSLNKLIFIDEDEIDPTQLKQQAKIPYGFYFYKLYKVFGLNYTYGQLIKFSDYPYLTGNTFLLEILKKYVQKSYQWDQDGNCYIQLQGGTIFQNVNDVNISIARNFFGLILYLLDVLNFKAPDVDIFIQIIENYLNVCNFDELREFLIQMNEFQQLEPTAPQNDMVMHFKAENDIMIIFNKTALAWLRQNYQKLALCSTLQSTEIEIKVTQILDETQSILQLLQQFCNDAEIERQRIFIEILKLIKKIDIKLLINIEQLKNIIIQNDCFTFMMELINRGDMSIFDTDIVEAIQDFIHTFYEIYWKHNQFIKGSQLSLNLQDSVLQRFYSQLTYMLINKKYYHSSLKILQKIIVGGSYCRDVILLFLGQIDHSVYQEQQYKKMVKDLIQTETPTLIKKKIVDITENITGFASNQDAYQSIQQIYHMLMNLYRYEQAFYFLVRISDLKLSSLQNFVKGTYHSTQPTVWAHFVLTAFIRILHLYLAKNFYPTFSFYQNKLYILLDEYDKLLLIKDFNIALSRMQDMLDQRDRIQDNNPKFNQHESAITIIDQPQFIENKNQLQYFYQVYMQSMHMSPYIKLTQQEYKDAAARLQKYSNLIPAQELSKGSKGSILAEAKKSIQQNIKQVKKVSQDNKKNVLQKQVPHMISQARKIAQKYENFIEDRKKSPRKIGTNKTLQEINRKEKQQLQSVKQSYKSSNRQRVLSIIQSIRNKRQKPDQPSKTFYEEKKSVKSKYGQQIPSLKFAGTEKQIMKNKENASSKFQYSIRQSDSIKNQSSKRIDQLRKQIQQKRELRKKQEQTKKQNLNRMQSGLREQVKLDQQRRRSPYKATTKMPQHKNTVSSRFKTDRIQRSIQQDALQSSMQQQNTPMNQSIVLQKQSLHQIQLDKSKKKIQSQIEKLKQKKLQQLQRKKQLQDKVIQQRKARQQQIESKKKKLQQQIEESRKNKTGFEKKLQKQKEKTPVYESKNLMKKVTLQQPNYISSSNRVPEVPKISKKQGNSSQSNSGFSGQGQYQLIIHSPRHSQKDSIRSKRSIGNDFMPVTMFKNSGPSIHHVQSMANINEPPQPLQNSFFTLRNQLQTKNKFETQKSIQMLEKQKKSQYIGSRVQIPSNASFKDIENLFKNYEPQAAKYLPKVELVKQSIKVGVQLIKRIYSVCKRLEIFYKFLTFLISYDSRYEDVIQMKALEIINQMIKMNVKIQFKELIPLQLILDVKKISIKDYYSYAYNVIRPHLVKAMKKPDFINVHGMAIIFRYGFGSNDQYFYKVYEEYCNVLIQNYSLEKADLNKLILLSEKLKNTYSNLNPKQRQMNFKKIIMSLKDDKRKPLVEQFKKMVQKKINGEMVSHMTEEFMEVVHLLSI